MKITSIKLLQSATYNRKQVTIFTSRATNSPALAQEDLDFEILPAIGVRVSGTSDQLIVPFQNIAEIRYQIEPKPKEEPKAAEPKVKAPRKGA